MQIFNPESLVEIIELEESGEDGLLNQLIEDYLKKQPVWKDLIMKSQEAKSFGDLELAAHSLKSSSRLLGLELLAESCAKIERGAREKRTEEHLISELQERAVAAVDALRRFRLGRTI